MNTFIESVWAHKVPADYDFLKAFRGKDFEDLFYTLHKDKPMIDDDLYKTCRFLMERFIKHSKVI